MTPSAAGRATRHARLLAVFGLLAGAGLSTAADAATYFVRADGGNAAQCTGLADAPYPGSGSAQACAFSHPFIALPPAQAPRIAGGDTLLVAAGDYRMGIGAPGAEACRSDAPYDCHLGAIPSGPSPAQPTRILGAGHESGCTAPPQLWANQRAFTVFDLRGSSNVEIGCFEVTDRASCIKDHTGGLACPATGEWGRSGLVAQDSANVRLHDLDIHGLAHSGIQAGRLRDWTLERVTLRANGWVGWDGDIGAGNSDNSGSMIFRETEIAWNGCAEQYPGGEITGCWAQSTGGYGDGLGTQRTGGHWLFEDSLVHHNTSDGIDLLYMADGGSVTVRRSWFEGNAGNQLKTKGNARVESSVVVGNCGYFDGRFATMQSGDHCRALGTAVSVGLFPTSTASLVNNTISSQGDCLVSSSGGGRIDFANNAMLGEPGFRDPTGRSCLHYSPEGSTTLSWNGDVVHGVRNDSCPPGASCADPGIANRSYAAFDPTPAPASVLIDGANPAFAPPTDHQDRARLGSGPDAGAVEAGY